MHQKEKDRSKIAWVNSPLEYLMPYAGVQLCISTTCFIINSEGRKWEQIFMFIWLYNLFFDAEQQEMVISNPSMVNLGLFVWVLVL